MLRTGLFKLCLVGSLALCLCHTAFSGPGDGVQFGNLTLHPFLSGSGGYDSNVGLSRRSNSEVSEIDKDGEESDTYTELRYGIKFGFESGDFSSEGSVYGYERQYSDFDELDENGFGQTLSLSAGSRDRLSVQMSESFSDSVDNTRRDLAIGGGVTSTSGHDLEGADRLGRELLTLGVALGRDAGEKLELDGGYSYFQVEYEDEAQFDITSSHEFEASLGLRFSEKSSVFTTGTYRLEDSEALSEDGEEYALRLGIRSRGTDKISYSVSLGYLGFQAERDLGDPAIEGDAEDIDESTLSFKGHLQWTITPKLALVASGGNGYSSTSFTANNAREVINGALRLKHRTTKSLTTVLRYSIRDDQLVDPIIVDDETLVEERIIQDLSLTANYAPSGNWFILYATGAVQIGDSEFNREDYEQVRGSLGVVLYY